MNRMNLMAGAMHYLVNLVNLVIIFKILAKDTMFSLPRADIPNLPAPPPCPYGVAALHYLCTINFRITTTQTQNNTQQCKHSYQTLPDS